MARRKRIPVKEDTHELLRLKKAENGARSFDELLRDMSEETFGERPEDGELPTLEDSLEEALFGTE